MPKSSLCAVYLQEMTQIKTSKLSLLMAKWCSCVQMLLAKLQPPTNPVLHREQQRLCKGSQVPIFVIMTVKCCSILELSKWEERRWKMRRKTPTLWSFSGWGFAHKHEASPAHFAFPSFVTSHFNVRPYQPQGKAKSKWIEIPKIEETPILAAPQKDNVLFHVLFHVLFPVLV